MVGCRRAPADCTRLTTHHVGKDDVHCGSDIKLRGELDTVGCIARGKPGLALNLWAMVRRILVLAL